MSEAIKEGERFRLTDISLPESVEKNLFSDGDGRDDEQHAEDVHIDGNKDFTEEEEIGNIINEQTQEEKDADAKKLDETYDSKSGFNHKGFNEDGFNKEGVDTEGFDKDGKLPDGREKTNFKDGFDEDGLNVQGLDKDGYNKDGINDKGFNADGKTSDGREEKDFNDKGFDKDGFDTFGFNSEGKDKEGKLKTDDLSEENQETDQSSSDRESLTVKSILDGKQKLELTDEDGKKVELKDIIDEHRNKTKWEKSNTEKAQDLSKDRTEHDQIVKDFQDKLKLTDEQVKKISESEFLKDADEYFDEEGKDPTKNPLRAILKTVIENSEVMTKRDAEAQEKATSDKTEADKTVDDHMKQIQKADKTYESMIEMQKVFDFSNEHGLNLIQGYNMMQVPVLEQKLKDVDATHKTEIESLQKELKERNAEVVKLKANPAVSSDDELDSGTGAEEEEEIVVDENSSSKDGWDTVTKGIKKLWGK